MAQRYDSSARRKPLSDAEFTRKLYAEGSLTDQELARTQQTDIRKPLSDAEFERRMRAEETARGIAGQRSPIDTNNVGNIYPNTLGPYRGSQPALHNDHPVIFEDISITPNRGLHTIAGALVPDKGLVGTVATGADLQGSTRFVIYGDPETGQPSSWSMQEWKETGEKEPTHGWPKYGWRTIPTAKIALDNPGLSEAMEKYRKSRK